MSALVGKIEGCQVNQCYHAENLSCFALPHARYCSSLVCYIKIVSTVIDGKTWKLKKSPQLPYGYFITVSFIIYRISI